jgi:hypothetical protein
MASCQGLNENLFIKSLVGLPSMKDSNMEGLLIIIKLLNNPFILKNRLNDFI